MLIISLIFGAVATYTPLVKWGIESGLFGWALDTFHEKLVVPIQKRDSLEGFTSKLMGKKSELLYGPDVDNPPDKGKARGQKAPRQKAPGGFEKVAK